MYVIHWFIKGISDVVGIWEVYLLVTDGGLDMGDYKGLRVVEVSRFQLRHKWMTILHLEPLIIGLKCGNMRVNIILNFLVQVFFLELFFKGSSHFRVV